MVTIRNTEADTAMWQRLSVQGATATRAGLSGKKILSTVTLLVSNTSRSAQQRVTNNLLNTLEVMLLRHVLKTWQFYVIMYLCSNVIMLRRFPNTPRTVVIRVIHPDTTILVYSSKLWLSDSFLSIVCATPHFKSTYSKEFISSAIYYWTLNSYLSTSLRMHYNECFDKTEFHCRKCF